MYIPISVEFAKKKVVCKCFCIAEFAMAFAKKSPNVVEDLAESHNISI